MPKKKRGTSLWIMGIGVRASARAGLGPLARSQGGAGRGIGRRDRLVERAVDAARRDVNDARGAVRTHMGARQVERLAGVDGETVRLAQAGATVGDVDGLAEHEGRRAHQDGGALAQGMARVAALVLAWRHRRGEVSRRARSLGVRTDLIPYHVSVSGSAQ